MASQPQEAEAGPSELTAEEILALLYLATSDSEKEETPEKDPLLCHEENALDDRLSCHEEIASSDEDELICDEILDDDDEVCQNVLDRFERQRAFQTKLLEQSGAGLDTSVGTFDFELQPYVDRQSSRLGVRERHFNTRLRQTGNFVDSPHVVHALQEGLRRAVNRVLTTTPNLHDQDRLYFTLSSNRLTSNFQGWGLRAGEWREGRERLDALFHRLAQALNSNEQFEMDDSFQLSITQVHHAPQGTGKRRQSKPGHQPLRNLIGEKHSIIHIHNYNDDLCCARALVVAKARCQTSKRTRGVASSRSACALPSLWLRCLDPIQYRSFPHRLPDPVGVCRPVFSHHDLWSPSRQTIDPVARERPLPCHYPFAWLFRVQLRVCPLLETL